MSPVIPGQSPKYSGVIDSRFIQDLQEKVAKVEERQKLLEAIDSIHILSTSNQMPAQEGNSVIAEFPFVTQAGTRTSFYFGGTGFCAAGGLFAIYCDVDAVNIGQSPIFINPTFTHTTFTPTWVSAGFLTQGEHKVRLRTSVGMKTDENDHYTLAWIESLT